MLILLIENQINKGVFLLENNNNNCIITFTGDIGFDKYMEGKWEDDSLLSPDILRFFDDSHHVIANVEGAVLSAQSISTENKDDYCHFMDSEAIRVLKRIKADIWNLANNHTMDMGDYGLNSTLELAKQNDVSVLGAGINLNQASQPIFFDEAGGVGIFSVGYAPDCVPATDEKSGVFSMEEYTLIKQRIKEIKNKCRWCIVVAHGGEEFTNLPHPYTRERYIQYLEYGADIVVAHHPHVVMNYETFDNKAIFYSLGNFIFDTDYQRAQFNTENGVILKLHLNENNFSIKSQGLLIDRKEEKIVSCETPDIFTDVNDEEYQKLLPLSAKAFVKAEINRKKFLHPEIYNDFSESDWEKYLLSTDREEYIEGQTMDFSVILPIAENENNKEWKKSSLPKVVEYICNQL